MHPHPWLIIKPYIKHAHIYFSCLITDLKQERVGLVNEKNVYGRYQKQPDT